MAKTNNLLFALNAGEVSNRALTRIDLAKLRLAAETQKNIIPRAIGYGTFRPGTKYIAATNNNDSTQKIPFVFNTTTKALIELTPSTMRVLVDDTPITRPSVTSAVTNGTFSSNLTGWTDADEAGGTSDFVTGGYMGLTGNGFDFAIRRQEVTVSGGNQGVEHALRVIVERGPVVMRVGSTSGGDEYVTETTLLTGVHSLAFTPSGNFFIQFQSNLNRQVLVDSVAVESSGIMTLPTPWGSDAIGDVQYVQSADVIFCAQNSARQRRIERRSQRSWSLVEYTSDNGPFRLPAASGIKITPSARTGNITLTASRPLWRSGHVGSLWRLTHGRQAASHTFTGDEQYTDYIRVKGAEPHDEFTIQITNLTGTGSTMTLQLSTETPDDWIDVASYTSNQSIATFDMNDSYGFAVRYARLIIKSGNYSSGTPTGSLGYDGSNKVGIVRVTAFSSSTSVSAEVITSLGSTAATRDWEEGSWSDVRSWPEGVALHDGRLWWGDRDYVYGSVSDIYNSYDDTVEGDSAPIIRSLALGPIEGVLWLLSMQRLLGGTASQIVSMRASSLDEPMTPTNFGVREISNRGTSRLSAIKVDTTGIYVQRNGSRVREIVFGVESNDYVTNDLTKFKPEMCEAGIVSIAVQNQPDTRIWCVLADGTVALCCYDRSEEMVCWIPVEFEGGQVVSVCVLPGEEEDDVYISIRRTVDGNDVCYIEKMAAESECVGGSLSKNIDCHYVYSGSTTATITGLSHLEGKQVVVWGNSKAIHDQSDMKTVTGGSITISEQVTSAVVGLPYDGRYKPAKLAYGAQLGTAIGQKKNIEKILILLADTVHKGVTYGRHFDDDDDAPSGYQMSALPRVYRGAVVPEGRLYENYEAEPYPLDGAWDTDARFCVKVMSPYPAHLLGFMFSMQTNEK